MCILTHWMPWPKHHELIVASIDAYLLTPARSQFLNKCFVLNFTHSHSVSFHSVYYIRIYRAQIFEIGTVGTVALVPIIKQTNYFIYFTFTTWALIVLLKRNHFGLAPSFNEYRDRHFHFVMKTNLANSKQRPWKCIKLENFQFSFQWNHVNGLQVVGIWWHYSIELSRKFSTLFVQCPTHDELMALFIKKKGAKTICYTLLPHFISC